jgi:hypothetical protein
VVPLHPSAQAHCTSTSALLAPLLLLLLLPVARAAGVRNRTPPFKQSSGAALAATAGNADTDSRVHW